MSQVQPNWKTLQAMLHCHYKAWQLAKDNSPSLAPPVDFNTPLQLPLQSLTPGDKLVLTALYSRHLETITVQQIKIVYANGQPATLKLRLNSTKARKLLQDTLDIISQDAPPPFYKNAHCPDCFFQDACYQKLNERNCISLLTGIAPAGIHQLPVGAQSTGHNRTKNLCPLSS
jgi:hypothetical protein